MKRLLAFTLAETLIVIGIIGVVSALTLPNLNSSTGEKEKVAKVKKIYQNLDDAVGRAASIYGPLNEWRTLDNTNALQVTRFGDRLTEFMKVSKNCGTTTNQGCWSKTSAKYLSGTASNATISDSAADTYRVILADGTSLAITTTGIRIDIDGPNKGSNIVGKDIFSFVFDASNSTIRTPSSDVSVGTLMSTGGGEFATNWVINFDNMDYLKAASNGKCNNSNVTLNASANPPVTQCN